eukprot:TRINITY_DN2010_c0_g2_i1.p1 TRINITY_DN2010_c0_g2~~TRINITY_DN2010_c0_g2_i1.p1  ORF type:complete len:439 (+),score=73.42 TRINITY_DN2010_c0_g2_i1:159-1319(+)
MADNAANDKQEPYWLDDVKKIEWGLVLTTNKQNPERNFHAGTLYNNKFYIYGGQCVEGRSKDVIYFDFDKAEWIKVEEIGDYQPIGRTVRNNYMYNHNWYFYGGYDLNRETVDVLEVYNFETKKWKRQECKGTLPGKLNYPAYWGWNHYFYLWGGTRIPNDGKTMNSSLFRLNLDTFVWETIQYISGGVETVQRPSCIVKNDSAYIFCGQNSGCASGSGSFAQMAKFEMYNNKFVLLESPPYDAFDAISVSGSGVLTNTIWFSNGWNYGPTNCTVAYHIPTNKFYVVNEEHPDPSHAHVSIVHKGKIYCHGGWTGHQQLGDLYMLDLSKYFLSGEWSRESHNLYPITFRDCVTTLLMIKRLKSTLLNLLPRYIFESIVKLASFNVY